MKRTSGLADEASSDRWPSYVDKGKQALWYLRELNKMQTLLDTAPETCQERINQRGDALSKSHKGAGCDAIKLAEEIGKELRRKFEVADKMKSEVESLRSKVRDFSEHEGAWDAPGVSKLTHPGGPKLTHPMFEDR